MCCDHDSAPPLPTGDRAIQVADVLNQVITYPGAPHSFFDRKYEEYADVSADAWSRVLHFIGEYST